MDIVEGEIIGNIHIAICQTSEGDNFFSLQTDNKDITHFLDVIETALLSI